MQKKKTELLNLAVYFVRLAESLDGLIIVLTPNKFNFNCFKSLISKKTYLTLTKNAYISKFYNLTPLNNYTIVISTFSCIRNDQKIMIKNIFFSHILGHFKRALKAKYAYLIHKY